MSGKRRTTRERINALSAAREWLGTYDAEGGGSLESGCTEGVPADMVAAYELLGEMLADLLAEETMTAIKREVRRLNPSATPAQVTKHARTILAKHPELVPPVI